MPREHRSGEPVVTAGLVRALLAAQHPDLAGLAVAEDVDPTLGGGTVRGWDNTMVRLGTDLALRLPRHEQGEALLDHEVTWLPRIAALTGLTLPAPVRTGVPGAGYPYRWAVVPWVTGTCAVHAAPERRDSYAAALAATLRRLHVPAPRGAPVNPYRGVPLAAVAGRFTPRWEALRRRVPADLARGVDAAWADSLAAPGHPGPPVWLHGDPHPDNTVLEHDATGEVLHPVRPSLVDFGDLCAGDPASDLGIALVHFTSAGAEAFSASYDAGPGAGPDAGEDLWRRARGWSLVVATLVAAQPPQDPLAEVGWCVLEQYR